MDKIQVFAATNVVVALIETGSAGCSAGGGSPQAAGGRTPTARSSSPGPEVYRRAAACLRAHGVPNSPDPQPDGTFVLPQRYAKLGKSGTRAQDEACRKYAVGGIRLAVRDSE